MDKYFVYILRTSSNTLYIGQTNNLERRLGEHRGKSKKASKYLKSFSEFELVYQEEHLDRGAAMRREIELKKLSKIKKEGLSMADEKILTRHPQGKSGRSIDKAKYDKVAKAIRSALREDELTHTDLMSRVKEALDGRFDGNISWYAETVKLDLEAGKAIERTSSRPQRYRLR